MKPNRKAPHRVAEHQADLIYWISKSLIDRSWPDQSTMFDEYWPFHEHKGLSSSTRRRQGAAEDWFSSPYVVGIVCGIATHLIIVSYPVLQSRLVGTVEQRLAALRDYIREFPSEWTDILRRVKQTHATRPDAEQIIDELDALLSESREEPDEH